MNLNDLPDVSTIEIAGVTHWLDERTGRTFGPISGGFDGDGGAGGDGSGDGTGAEGGAGDGTEGGDGAGGDGTDSKPPAKVEFDAAQKARIAEIVNTERAKERVKAEGEAKTKAEREKLDEVDRLKAENADKDKATAEATAKANTRAIRADAKVAAVDAKVDPTKLDRFIKVLAPDLADVTVDDDGEPDAKAISKAVAAVLKDFPEFKAAAKGGASGGDFSDQGEKKPAKNLEDAIAAKYAS